MDHLFFHKQLTLKSELRLDYGTKWTVRPTCGRRIRHPRVKRLAGTIVIGDTLLHLRLVDVVFANRTATVFVKGEREKYLLSVSNLRGDYNILPVAD